MRTYNYNTVLDSFLDSKEAGNPFYTVTVGSGNPQRLYPETAQDVADCEKKVFRGVNRPLGTLSPGRLR